MRRKVYIGKPTCKTNINWLRYFVVKIKEQPEQKFILNEEDEIKTVIGGGTQLSCCVLDIFINEELSHIVSLDNLEYFYIGREVI